MIDDEGLQKNCERVGNLFLSELIRLRDRFEVIGDVRGKGLMLGIELVKNKVQISTTTDPLVLTVLLEWLRATDMSYVMDNCVHRMRR